jgi:dienelactone hydrolase
MRKLIACCLLLIAYSTSAQKKPLDHSVYDSWQHIGERMISNDGKWVVYTVDPQEGDNELVIQSADAKYKKTIARGYTAAITEDSRFVIFRIKPFYKDTRDAKIKKKKADDMPKDSFAVVELGKDSVWKTARVKNYKTPEKEAGWVAYHLEKTIEKKDDKPKKPETDKKVTDSLTRVIDSLQTVIASMPVKKKNRDEDFELTEDSQLTTDFADGDDASAGPVDAGTDLILRNLATGQETIFSNVLEYYFSKKGQKLLIETAKNPKDSMSRPSVVYYDLKTLEAKILSRGGNEFKNFSMTEDGSHVAWLAERDARPKELQKFYKVWHYKQGMDSALMLADKNSVDMKLGMTVSEYGSVSFSKSGKRLFFGVAPIQPPKDTSIIEMDMPKLDIWHYNDDYLQTVQLVPNRLRQAQQENFLAVYDFDRKTIRQLGSKEIPQVLQTNEGDGEQFVGITDFGKRIESQWQGNTLRDIYAIDVTSGDTTLVKRNMEGTINAQYISPTGKYIMWYDSKQKHYFVWDGAKTRNITEKIKVPLWNEDHDSPGLPGPYGVMGWHEGDNAVYIYDKYEIWKVDPTTGSIPDNWIKSGRTSKTTSRYIQLDPEKRFFKDSDLILLKTSEEVSKYAGFAILDFYKKKSGIVWTVGPGKHHADGYAVGEFMIGPITASKGESMNLIFTLENFTVSPDLYIGRMPVNISDDSESLLYITEAMPLSEINPQQSQYNWGTAELFKWKAYNGKEAEGIVYKPENFDPKKKYPMIVYFYETLSETLFDYKEPAPIRSAVNIPFFVSRGYIIFVPDIHYTTGHPGKNAYDYIVSGTRAVVKKGYVDSTNMALQGHSWGGYQAAQVATMTKLYKAIWAGAPVANMTSAYGGIRWESGLARQFQYEKTQSRIGGTLWEKLPLYLENSPLFHLNKVTAPMVIMHNDADGAVPWYQGIELFTGLRRLGKKVWMFNYNGQGHGLTQRQDMRDYQIRMQQFFDWILKGEKPAKWIVEGLPAVKKGKDWGLEIVE